MTRTRITFLSLLTCLGLGLALPAFSHAAATITLGGDRITVAGDDAPDDILLSLGGDGANTAEIEITLWNGGSATGCALHPWEDNTWVCPARPKMTFDLKGGDDTISVYETTEVPFTAALDVNGGPGEDQLRGASGDDVIRGGADRDSIDGTVGNDRLFGEEGDDLLVGMEGDDLLDGGPGNDELETAQAARIGAFDLDAGSDTYVGGAGQDSFSYFSRSADVKVTLDGRANDGESGENDNVGADIETVGGGSGDDTLTGSAANDYLWGSDGDDIINGGGGNDELQGDDGSDRVNGQAGNDELEGGCDNDVVIGGPGRDSMISDGCSSADRRGTFDEIVANDGVADALIFCSMSGDTVGDTAIVDRVDPVTNNGPGACARIQMRGGATPAGKTVARLGPNLKLLAGNGKKGRAARQQIQRKSKWLTLGTLVAAKKTRVVAEVTATRKRRTVKLGRVAVTVAAGKSRVLRLKLRARGLKALRGQRRAPVKVTFRVGKQVIRKSWKVPVR